MAILRRRIKAVELPTAGHVSLHRPRPAPNLVQVRVTLTRGERVSGDEQLGQLLSAPKDGCWQNYQHNKAAESMDPESEGGRVWTGYSLSYA